MKRIGLLVLLITIILIGMSFTDSGVSAIDNPMGDVIQAPALTNNIVEDVTIQDLLNVEFEATYQAEAEFATHYVSDNDKGIEAADVQYVYIGNLRGEDLRALIFL